MATTEPRFCLRCSRVIGTAVAAGGCVCLPQVFAGQGFRFKAGIHINDYLAEGGEHTWWTADCECGWRSESRPLGYFDTPEEAAAYMVAHLNERHR